MASEKLLDPFTIKLEIDQKQKLFGLAEIHGTTPSEIIGSMVEKYIVEQKHKFDSMQSIFGNEVGGGNE